MADSNFEAKFGQLSDTQIHERAPVLAPYKVGFQLIDKDDDETRAVGAMAYKIGDQWAYVPCFWLKGKLKGYELLYLKQQDIFVPLKEGWINYIKTKQPFKMGKASDRPSTDPDGGPGSINISEQSTWGYKKTAHDLSLMDADTMEAMKNPPDSGQKTLLEEWLPKLGKEAAFTFVNTLRSNSTFADSILQYYGPDELASIVKPFQKQAALDINPVTVITDSLSKEAQELKKSEKEVLIRDGIFIKDAREITSDVFSEEVASKTLESPKETGIYDVLMADGSYKRLGVVLPKALEKDSYSGCKFRSYKSKAFLLNPNEGSGEVCEVNIEDILARRPAYLKDEKKEDIGKMGKALRASDLISDDWYLIMDRKGTAIEVHWLRSTNGTEQPMYMLKGGKEPVYLSLTGKEGDMIVHRDQVFVPDNARLFKVKGYRDEEYALGNVNTVLNKMTKEGMDRMKVYSDGFGYQITSSFESTRAMHKTAALTKLVKDYGISAPNAKAIINDLKDARPTRGIAKRYFIKLAASEISYNFGNNRQESGDDMEQTERNIKSNHSKLDNPSVQEVQRAAQTGVKEVLDMSVMTSLAKKTKALDIVDDYLVDLTKSLDRVGRLLFLFYWHNDTFKDRYGNQEMYDLETALKDVFESTSDLVLFLKERTTSSNTVLEGGVGDLSESLGNA